MLHGVVPPARGGEATGGGRDRRAPEQVSTLAWSSRRTRGSTSSRRSSPVRHRHARRRQPGPHGGRHGRHSSWPGGAKDELTGTLHERFLVIDFEVSGKPFPTFHASTTEPPFLDAVRPLVAWLEHLQSHIANMPPQTSTDMSGRVRFDSSYLLSE